MIELDIEDIRLLRELKQRLIEGLLLLGGDGRVKAGSPLVHRVRDLDFYFVDV